MNGIEFSEVRKKGRKIQSNIAIAYVMPAEKSWIGIITSKRLGSAVKRNRIRRRTREALKEVLHQHQNANIVLIPSGLSEKMKFADIKAKLDMLISRALNDK